MSERNISNPYHNTKSVNEEQLKHSSRIPVLACMIFSETDITNKYRSIKS